MNDQIHALHEEIKGSTAANKDELEAYRLCYYHRLNVAKLKIRE